MINPIHYLTKQGLTISIVHNKFNVKPSNLVTAEIAHYIKHHKNSIKSHLLTPAKSLEDIPLITELNPQQTKGLNQLAKIFKVILDYLLQHTLIEQFDLVE